LVFSPHDKAYPQVLAAILAASLLARYEGTVYVFSSPLPFSYFPLISVHYIVFQAPLGFLSVREFGSFRRCLRASVPCLMADLLLQGPTFLSTHSALNSHGRIGPSQNYTFSLPTRVGSSRSVFSLRSCYFFLSEAVPAFSSIFFFRVI